MKCERNFKKVFNSGNKCPIRNAQLVRVIARVGFVIVSILVVENLGILANSMLMTFKPIRNM